KAAEDVARTTTSARAASARRAIDADGDEDGWGKSVPARLSACSCWAASNNIPPNAGGGGRISGASTMRGRSRSKTGSARAFGRETGIAAERGNSITLAD